MADVEALPRIRRIGPRHSSDTGTTVKTSTKSWNKRFRLALPPEPRRIFPYRTARCRNGPQVARTSPRHRQPHMGFSCRDRYEIRSSCHLPTLFHQPCSLTIAGHIRSVELSLFSCGIQNLQHVRSVQPELHLPIVSLAVVPVLDFPYLSPQQVGPKYDFLFRILPRPSSLRISKRYVVYKRYDHILLVEKMEMLVLCRSCGWSVEN